MTSKSSLLGGREKDLLQPLRPFLNSLAEILYYLRMLSEPPEAAFSFFSASF